MEYALAKLDLNLLYTLYEVARTGSVTTAARILRRTQPAISTRLRILEEQLGVQVFERSRPNLQLTPVGRAVVDEVCLLVAQLGAVVDRTRDVGVDPVGTIRVGALPTVCAYLLAPAVDRLTRKHTRTRVRMIPGMTASQVDALRGGELDMLLSVGAVRGTGLEVRAIGVVEACAVFRAKPRVPAGVLSLRRFADTPFVSYGKIGDPFFDAVWTFLEHAHLVENIRIEVSNIQTIKQLVLDGAGASILPRYTIVEPTLAARRVRGLDVKLPLQVATRPNAERMPIVRELLGELAFEVDARRLR